jgi:hypothetical protein
MLLKDLVLYSLEDLNKFIVNEKQLDKELYEELAYEEVKNYYIDVKENIPYIIVNLED